MLSENIRSLRESLEKFTKSGATFHPGALGAVCSILISCEIDARQLEAATISPVARGGNDLGQNVVRVDFAARWPSRSTPNDGGAA